MTKRKIKAILIDVIDPKTSKEESAKRMEEIENLLQTYGGIVIVKIMQKKALPDYSTYIGKGKVKEIQEIAKREKANIVIVNNLLKPRQIFQLNEMFRDLDMQAWDRVDLILKIFDKHAKSTEAKLQIELASIRHMGPRIYGMGIELSRQAGAMGVRAGAGESNIEMMKRHLRKQELTIKKKLEHYKKIRSGHRKRRKRKNFNTAAIVGYTNAGKSSLLKALTGKETYIANQLFATLGTKVGKLYLPASQKSEEEYVNGKEILLSDTIGFIQDLPPFLIEAFESTLAETVEADLMLHVIDINDEDLDKKIRVVEKILDDLEVSTKKKIYIFNKLDLIGHKYMFEEKKEKTRRNTLLKAGKDTAALLGWVNHKKVDEALYKIKKLEEKYKKHNPVFVSAEEKINLKELIKKISENI